MKTNYTLGSTLEKTLEEAAKNLHTDKEEALRRAIELIAIAASSETVVVNKDGKDHQVFVK